MAQATNENSTFPEILSVARALAVSQARKDHAEANSPDAGLSDLVKSYLTKANVITELLKAGASEAFEIEHGALCEIEKQILSTPALTPSGIAAKLRVIMTFRGDEISYEKLNHDGTGSEMALSVVSDLIGLARIAH